MRSDISAVAEAKILLWRFLCDRTPKTLEKALGISAESIREWAWGKSAPTIENCQVLRTWGDKTLTTAELLSIKSVSLSASAHKVAFQPIRKDTFVRVARVACKVPRPERPARELRLPRVRGETVIDRQDNTD